MKQEELISLDFIRKNLSTAFALLGISRAHGWEEKQSTVLHGVQDHRQITVIINRPKRRIVFRVGLKEYTMDARRNGDSIARDFRSRIAGHWVRTEDRRFAAECDRQKQLDRIDGATAELEARLKTHVHTTSSRDMTREIHAEVEQFEGAGYKHRVKLHVWRHYEDSRICVNVQVDTLSQAQAESLLQFLQNGGI